MLRFLTFIVPRAPGQNTAALAPAGEADTLILLAMVLGSALIAAMVYGLWEILRGRARQVALRGQRLVFSPTSLAFRCTTLWLTSFGPGFVIFLILLTARVSRLPPGGLGVLFGGAGLLGSLLYLLSFDRPTTFAAKNRTIHRGRRIAPFSDFSHVLVHPKGGFLWANPDPRLAISLEAAAPTEKPAGQASHSRPLPFRRIFVTRSETEVLAAAKIIADFVQLPLRDLRNGEPPRAT